MEIPGSEEEYQDYLEEEQATATEAAEEGMFPRPSLKDNIFTFFRHVLRLPDSSKVGNLSEGELGKLPFNVRNCQYLSLIGELTNDNDFSTFFKKQGEITLSTSASKRGWFTELVVSQKKFAERLIKLPTPQQQPRKGFFARRQPPQQLAPPTSPPA